MIRCPKCLANYDQDGYWYCPFDGTKLKNSDLDNFKCCENCKGLVDITDESGHKDGCDFVWGRRGWRQLGVYDG
jgi:hypothetical protein